MSPLTEMSDANSSEHDFDIVNNNDVYSEINDWSVSSSNKKHIIEYNHNQHKIYRKVNNKTVRITIYASNNTPNAGIVNAVSGNKYNSRVGTRDETIYFSTLLSTGECGQTSPLLFYDSPEQCEEHLMLEIDKNIKKNWYIQYYELLATKKSEHTDRQRRSGLLTLQARSENGTVAYNPSTHYSSFSDALKHNVVSKPADTSLVFGFGKK